MRLLVFTLICFAPSLCFAQARFVAVTKQAKLYASNLPNSPSFSANTDGYFTFEFIEQRGNRFRVRTITEEPATSCYDMYEFGIDFEVDFWVQSKDVMWVTSTSVEENYDDGTSMALNPGVVLKPGDDSESWFVDVGVDVPITYRNAKKTFLPKRMKEVVHWGTPLDVDKVMIGGVAFEHAGTLHAKWTINSDAQEVAEIETLCAKIVLRTEGLRYSSADGIGGTFGFGMSGGHLRRGIRGGATLYWITGETAGRKRSNYVHEVTHEDVTRKVDDRYCFLFGAGEETGTKEPEVELCVDEADLANW